MEAARRITGGAEDHAPKAQWLLSQAVGLMRLKSGDTGHLSGLRLTSVFLNRARSVFMASSCRFSSTQATWGSTRVGWGGVPAGQEGHPPPPPQKDRFLFPGPPQTLEQDSDASHPISSPLCVLWQVTRPL